MDVTMEDLLKVNRTIETCTTVGDIIEATELSQDVVLDALEGLKELGLVKGDDDRFCRVLEVKDIHDQMDTACSLCQE